MTRSLAAIVCTLAFLGVAFSAERSETRPPKLAQARICLPAIHCGIKDGKAKEYPTNCAAEDDGATNITAKGAGPCPEVK